VDKNIRSEEVIYWPNLVTRGRRRKRRRRPIPYS